MNVKHSNLKALILSTNSYYEQGIFHLINECAGYLATVDMIVVSERFFLNSLKYCGRITLSKSIDFIFTGRHTHNFLLDSSVSKSTLIFNLNERKENVAKRIRNYISGGGKDSQEVVILDKESRLSEREAQVYQYISQGIPDEMISKMLLISRKTVSSHRSHILKKLNCENKISLHNNFSTF